MLCWTRAIVGLQAASANVYELHVDGHWRSDGIGWALGERNHWKPYMPNTADLLREHGLLLLAPPSPPDGSPGLANFARAHTLQPIRTCRSDLLSILIEPSTLCSS
jgi:hypothetical protein